MNWWRLHAAAISCARLLVCVLHCDGFRSAEVAAAFNRLKTLPTPEESLSNELSSLKESGLLTKWASTNLQPKKVSKDELRFATRTSFGTSDYLQDILNSVKGDKDFSPEKSFAVTSVTSVLFGGFCVPLLPLNDLSKNILGVLFLFTPFLLIVLSLAFPSLLVKSTNSDSQGNEQERICYHEAGHFLAGYLCGVAVLDYDTTGDRDAGAAVMAYLPDIRSLIGRQSLSPEETLEASKTANLLVVAMAGMVAETLRFGTTKGGREDFPIALEILRRYGVANKEVDFYLRWTLLKALSILRIHRDELDELARLMGEKATIYECMSAIETTSASS